MLIGVDFDNTIACYDDAFHAAAVERGLIPRDVPVDKTSVRDYLRSLGRDAQFTELQGYVYGPGMKHVAVYPGLAVALQRLAAAGNSLCLISHKTKTPFAGPPYDLHAAALEFLATRRLVGDEGAPFRRGDVWFELTKEAKIARIGALGCEAFVDDLPEILAMPLFPATTRRILFDPAEHYPAGEWHNHRFETYRDWAAIATALLRDEA